MRPVNLIPPEARRGQRGPARTGPAPYAIVAVLAVALFAVTMIALTNNQISDRETEKANLEAQVAVAQAEAQRFQSYVDFASLRKTREQTIGSLARSRFDWERVLHELAIVIPHDVWLTNLDAKASATSGSSTSSTSSESITGPSLEISGCAEGHEGVARFLVALRDIDGLTRATVTASEKTTSSSTGGGPASSTTSTTGTDSQDCATRRFLSTFAITAAFDAVPVAAAESTTTTVETTTPPTTTTPTSTPQTNTATSTTASSDEQQTSAPELQQQKDSAAEQDQKGHKAVDTFIPGTVSTP